AGATGSDGPSHNGMWDMTTLQAVPGLRIAAPRDATRLRRQLREALDVDDAPTVVRYPKGPAAADVEPVASLAGMDVLKAPAGEPSQVLLVSIGAMADVTLAAAGLLDDLGVPTT